MKHVLAVALVLGLGCQPLEPLGGGSIRVAEGQLHAEEWFALPDGRELVAARDSDGTLHLVGFDAFHCVLGDGRIRSVVGRDWIPGAPEVAIVLTASGRVEVRNLDCELLAPPLTGARQTSMAFEHRGTFVSVVRDEEGVLWLLDALTGGHETLRQGTAEAHGIRNQSNGRIAHGVQWTDRVDEDPALFWVVDDGQMIVSHLDGSEIDRAGEGVVGWRGFDPMWLWDSEGLKRWTPGGAQAELVVPEGCALEGVDPLYVRAPCDRGDLLALNPTTDETTLVAQDVIEHRHFANGDWLTYVVETEDAPHQLLVSTDGEAREVPREARPIASHGDRWFLRVGGTIVWSDPSVDGVEEVLSNLHAVPTALSDGRFLLVYGEGGEPTLAAFDPRTLDLEVLATGAPAGDVRLAVASLTGRSVLFYRSGVEDGAGLLEAMLWPEGPVVTVADGVTAYKPLLTAQPPALLYSTGGDDPALWLVPI